MAPNEQESVAAQEVVAAEKPKPKLGTLEMVEKVVNEYAKPLARRHTVPEDKYTILLSTDLSRGIMGVRRGPVAQIILLWPDAQPYINSLLDDAFRLIKKNKLIDQMSIESSMIIKRRAEERRKWFREKIGVDESDIILDLIPKHRIRTRVITTVEYEDMLTGEKLAVTHTARKEQYRGQDVSNWMKLSRIVRDNHPEEETRYADIEPVVAEFVTNPELQDALAEIERADRGIGAEPTYLKSASSESGSERDDGIE